MGEVSEHGDLAAQKQDLLPLPAVSISQDAEIHLPSCQVPKGAAMACGLCLLLLPHTGTKLHADIACAGWGTGKGWGEWHSHRKKSELSAFSLKQRIVLCPLYLGCSAFSYALKTVTRRPSKPGKPRSYFKVIS